MRRAVLLKVIIRFFVVLLFVFVVLMKVVMRCKITLNKSKEYWGIVASFSLMNRTLLRMGYTHRKLSRISHKANTFSRVMFRERAREWVTSLDQLVFIDETSKNRASINRQYGWGPKRTTLFNKDFVLRGKRMSVIGAYGTRGC